VHDSMSCKGDETMASHYKLGVVLLQITFYELFLHILQCLHKNFARGNFTKELEELMFFLVCLMILYLSFMQLTQVGRHDVFGCFG